MKAAVFEGRKAPQMLAIREVAKPEPGDGQVLVRVVAASINAADVRSMRMGIVRKGRIMGADIAGRVEAVGKGVSRFKPGDEVLAELPTPGFGGFAEYAAAPETTVTLKPAGVLFEEAAALPMASCTALQALKNWGGVKAGQKVLIVGASGGVGTYAVQLAKHLGADVTAVCSARSGAKAAELGADRVVDYAKGGFTRDGCRYDRILAVNGSYPLTVYRRLLAENGVCVLIGGSLKQIFKCMLFGALVSTGGRQIRLLSAKPGAADLAYIAGLAAQGVVAPVIDRGYPLDEAAEAVRYVGEGHARGKVVLRVGA